MSDSPTPTNSKTKAATAAKYERNQRVFNSFRFYTPYAVWLIIVAAAFLCFFDQGVTFAAVPAVREDPVINAVEGRDPRHHHNGNTTTPAARIVLSTTLSGIYAGIFMLGFTVATPFVAAQLHRFKSNNIVAAGMIGWVVCVAAVACSPNYYCLILFRFLVGAADACFSSLLVVIIDNISPKAHKTLMISAYYATMPIGTALGMAYSGRVSRVRVLGQHGWRVAYMCECFLGVALAVLLFHLPDAYNIYDMTKAKSVSDQDGDAEDAVAIRGDDANADADEAVEADESVDFVTGLCALVRSLDFTCVAIGYSAFDFLITAFTSWCVMLLVQGPYGLSSGEASMLIGVVVGGGGLIGTIVGGVCVDRLGGVEGRNGISRCILWGMSCAMTGFILGFCAVLTSTVRDFLLFFVPAVITMTMNTAGLTVAVLNITEKKYRAFCMSGLLFLMNALGDFPAPLVTGAISRAFAGDCEHATKEECEMLGNGTFYSNATVATGGGGDGGSSGGLERFWFWEGKCQWNEAALKGDVDYCANTSQVNRAMMVVTGACLCIIVPLWATVIVRRWGTEIVPDGAAEDEDDVAADAENKLVGEDAEEDADVANINKSSTNCHSDERTPLL